MLAFPAGFNTQRVNRMAVTRKFTPSTVYEGVGYLVAGDMVFPLPSNLHAPPEEELGYPLSLRMDVPRSAVLVLAQPVATALKMGAVAGAALSIGEPARTVLRLDTPDPTTMRLEGR